jgi:hypothetical protein
MSVHRSLFWIRTAAFVISLAVPIQARAIECGAEWTPRFSGLDMDGIVAAMTVFDDGTGPALYAGGGFSTAGEVSANRIAKLDGSQWLPLGGGIGPGNGTVWAMTVFDDGTGTALYVGGDFLSAGGRVVNRIARWDGAAWSSVGGGMGGGEIRGAMIVFDDGSGPALYAGGDFTTAGGTQANHIAKWDGEQWSPLGSGTGGTFSSVRALAVFDDGSGPALYVGGNFATAGGITVNGIAKWDGDTWSPLGSGVGHELPEFRLVRGLTVFDDGTGPALYATGQFTSAGGVPAARIASWDGAAWSGVGGGLTSEPGDVPTGRRFAILDDGTGSALYVGGTFTIAGGQAVNYIAKWDGVSWSPLGSGMNATVYSLTVFEEGDGLALFVGGAFTPAGDIPSARIAEWLPDCVGDFDKDRDVDLDDLNTFVAVLTGTDTTPGHLETADINGDGAADGKDIQPFVGVILGE